MPGTNYNYSGSAIICIHAALSIHPIMLAERSEPDDPTDTGWQFLCAVESHDDVEDAKIWALDEILEFEPSLKPFMDKPPGTRLFREKPTAPWQISTID